MKKLNIILSVLSMMLLGVGSAILGTSSFLSSPTEDGKINKVSTAPIISPKEEPVEEITYTYKTYEDYFVDYEISKDTITEADLTGTGSEGDPYIVNSTKGFLYLTNKTISGLSIDSKYIELNCDIILNDETFDENGNPRGGDRIVYSWEMISTWRLVKINGNGFKISGVYINDCTQEIVRFCNSTLDKIENLNLSNVFLNGATAVSCFGSIYEAINCNLLSGNIIISVQNGYGAAFFDTIITKAKNCNNFANAGSFSAYTVGGIAKRNSTYALIEDCNNYGTIKAQTVNGGILGQLEGVGVINNCSNYGNILTDYYHSGGLVGKAYSGTISNSTNYGQIVSGFSNTGIMGSFVGVANGGNLNIYNCKNYGYIYEQNDATQQPGMIGYLLGSQEENEHVINIRGCKLNSKSGEQIFQSMHASSGRKTYLNIEDCEIIHQNIQYEKIFLFATNIVEELFMNVNNIKIVNINNKLDMMFFKDIYSYGKLKLEVSNLFVTSKAMESNISKLFYYNVSDEKFEVVFNSMIFYDVNMGNGFYLGENFNGYYVSWRTGRIGLVALDGRGFFQGQIDEEWLLNNDYKKKEI